MTQPRSDSFNALDGSWIHVIDLSGQASALSPLATLTRAHELVRIQDPSPQVRVALLRFLGALFLAAGRGEHLREDSLALLRAGRFDPSPLEAYADRWRPRFELFDAHRPFFQAPFAMDDVKRSPVSRLIPEMASGNNATLFDHALDDVPRAMSPAEALRALVAHQLFGLAGLNPPLNVTDAPLARGVAVVPAAATLFETLVFSLPPYRGDQPIPNLGDDRPTWEQDPRVPDRAGTPVRGYLDYLTWQSRHIRLVRDEDGLIRWCHYRQGHRLPPTVEDPFAGYRSDPKSGHRLVRRLNPDRALWRDSHTLLEEYLGDGDTRTSVLRALGDLADHSAEAGVRMAGYRLRATGAITRQAKVESMRDELLPVGDAFVADPRLRPRVREMLEMAEVAFKALRNGAWKTAELMLAPASDEPGGRRADAEDVRALITSFGLGSDFWPRLEPEFALACARIADSSLDDHPAVVVAWREVVRSAARTAFGRVESVASGTGRNEKASARGAQVFRMKLASALPDPARPQNERTVS